MFLFLFLPGTSDVVTMTACGDLSGKHPVSALMELATKRRWGPPNFVQAFEVGPSHKKQYIFKVASAMSFMSNLLFFLVCVLKGF